MLLNLFISRGIEITMYLYFLLLFTSILSINAMDFPLVNTYHAIKPITLASQSDRVGLAAVRLLPNPVTAFQYADNVNPETIRQQILDDSQTIENELASIINRYTTLGAFSQSMPNVIESVKIYLTELETTNFYQFLASDPINHKFREVLFQQINRQKTLLLIIKSYIRPIVVSINSSKQNPITDRLCRVYRCLESLLRPIENA